MSQRAPWAATTLAVLTLLTGCGDPELLDPTEEPLAADRERLVEHMTGGLTAIADHLGAGDELGTRIDTGCTAGTDNWKIHDTHRSTCGLTITTGFPLEAGPDAAFGGLDGLDSFEEALDEQGWGSIDWFVQGNDWGTGVDVDWMRANRRPVTDVIGVRLWSADGDGTFIEASFRPSDVPVGPASPGTVDGGYYADTAGEDWQDAWSTARDRHPFLIVGYGHAVLAEQPW
ncbi:hypothetical protein [Modestobacter sp. VKM Ac-2978]|uniref:hypothetical protein n=1 Tax=Modestobacter sp. VKM Ac-2978 TaxID=3004132 RepID=UPI0022AA4313|nr:hypothetical protein [Modestobacter sp. VKM Ac-2978]MCZ2847191.1 hypothetical protein [Modestobacter sp. VKM Ac-2978]